MPISFQHFAWVSIPKKPGAPGLGAGIDLAQTRLRRKSSIDPSAMPSRSRVPAEALLRGSALPVYEVAELAGFRSPYHFSDAFKKTLGQTPLQYLKGGAS